MKPAKPRSSRDIPPHRLELTVWPQTPTQPWRAELRADAQASPQCFDYPLALLLALTQLPGTVASQSGLR